jgi:hypothetical protein
MFVFPEPAHRALERKLGEALGRCGDLLAATVAALIGAADGDQIHAASDEIDDQLWAAGGIAAPSRYPSRMRRHPAHPQPR